MSAIAHKLTSLQQLLVELSSIDRNHYRPATDRRENVAEHSLSVATLAWFLHQYVQSQTKLELVLKYAIAHDLVETRAGDVNTYADRQARAQKELSESQALQAIAASHAYFPDLVQTMQAYQAMSDPEALFVWTTDKIQAYILGYLDDWRCYHQYPVSPHQYDHKAAEQIEQGSPELKPIFTEIIAWTKKTY